jgi:hypothetical protein
VADFDAWPIPPTARTFVERFVAGWISHHLRWCFRTVFNRIKRKGPSISIRGLAQSHNRHLSVTDTPAIVLLGMIEAKNQFSLHPRDANEAAELGQRFLVGEAFLTVSDKEG